MSEDGVYGYLELLYRGSQDGCKASDFHDKCDNKGATITVIWSTGDFIFGGFSDKAWTSSGNYCASDKAFLFSLKSPSSEVGLTKMCINQNRCSYAMGHTTSFGPYFGSGSDLRILSDVNIKSESYSNLRRTYDVPPEQTNTFLAGSNHFKVS